MNKQEMKLTVDQLRVGDKLRFPNGDVWEVRDRASGSEGCPTSFDVVRNDGYHTHYNLAELASILSAVEVERKPEKVTFIARVAEGPPASGPVGWLAGGVSGSTEFLELAPFIGQEVEVEVRPLAKVKP